jgi:Nucleotidyltransferase domain
MMDEAAIRALVHELRSRGVDAAEIAAAGGGVWCFGSRAAGCAKPESDWDVLMIGRAPAGEHRIRRGRIDLVKVCVADLGAWTAGELATHIAAYGVRLDPGRALALHAAPAVAAPRKCAVTGARARTLDALWAALGPSQRDREALRLRRDVHRAWLLSRGSPIPPTALLEQEWAAASPRARAAILKAIAIPVRLLRAIAQQDD